MKKISIIVPVYNEEKTVHKTLKRVLNFRLSGWKKEIIVVNDGSKDRTATRVISIKDKRIIFINKKKNEGKGSAVMTGIKKATGQVLVIQDADLEYDPAEITRLIKPIETGMADVVYGSRFIGSEPHRVLFFWHMIGNKFLTLLSNMITNLNLTDMETCYKMFTYDVAKKLKIEEKRFGFEPEFTIKVSKMGVKIYEMGIGYSGRNYKDGKKISWKDGIWAVWCMIKYGILQ